MTLILLSLVGLSLRGQHEAVNRSLATARAELHQTLDRLNAAQTQLGSTNGQVDTVDHTLASDAALLSQDQAQLANTRTRNYLQGVDVSVLHVCLAGVERALNQFALGDRSGAIATLGGVVGDCQEATPAGS